MTSALKSTTADFRQKVEQAFERLGNRAVPLTEFLAVEVPEPQDGDTWGNWTFHKRTLKLQFKNSQNDLYDVELERIDSILELIVCLKCFYERAYSKPEDVGNLFCAIQDLSHAFWETDTNVTGLIRVAQEFTE